MCNRKQDILFMKQDYRNERSLAWKDGESWHEEGLLIGCSLLLRSSAFPAIPRALSSIWNSLPSFIPSYEATFVKFTCIHCRNLSCNRFKMEPLVPISPKAFSKKGTSFQSFAYPESLYNLSALTIPIPSLVHSVHIRTYNSSLKHVSNNFLFYKHSSTTFN